MNGVFDVIVVLGAPNDAEGRLSAIARSRAEQAVAEYHKRPGCKVLLTGGFGDDFNTADQPHAHYVAQHLLQHGVDPGDILDYAESSNTVEDAVLTRRILEGQQVGEVCVVTSDFHCRRAELIFKQVFPANKVIMVGTSAPLSATEQARRVEHEIRALRQIEQQGWVIHPPTAGGD